MERCRLKNFAVEGEDFARGGTQWRHASDSRCAWSHDAHICALTKQFFQVAKDGEEGWVTIGECFFVNLPQNQEWEGGIANCWRLLLVD